MSWISDIINAFSFARRREHRAEHQLRMRGFELRKQTMDRAEVKMQRAWEAADNDRFRGSKWLTSQLSINSDLEIDLATLWDRAEDLVRNDAYASSAVNGRVDNVIGTGMTFHSRIRAAMIDRDEDYTRQLNEQRERVFRQWARHDRFQHKQRLYEKSKAIYGEALGVIADIGNESKPIPLTWQIINPRRLETPPRLDGNPLVRLGIRFADESYTDIEGYWIRDTDPHDTVVDNDRYTFYPAWRVTHSFEALVPGQIRGVPWLSPVMGLLKDIKDFREAKLIAEQVAACTTTFISCPDPVGRAAGNASSTTDDGARLEELEPGRIEYIGEDDTVHHVDPDRPGGTFAPFVDHHAMTISAGLRYSYSMLTKDFRKSSFANGRLEMADARKTFECWQVAAADDALRPVIERATEEMVMLGLLDIEASVYRDDADAYNAHQMKPTRWRMAVNPKQENQADVVDVENLFASRTDKCDEREQDFDDVLATKEREEVAILQMQARLLAKRKELGLPEPAEADRQQPQNIETEPEDFQRQLEAISK